MATDLTRNKALFEKFSILFESENFGYLILFKTVMEPHTGKLAFRIGMFMFIFALMPLRFLEPGSAEFVVDIIAITMSLALLGFVIWDVRRQTMLEKKNLIEQATKESNKKTRIKSRGNELCKKLP